MIIIKDFSDLPVARDRVRQLKYCRDVLHVIVIGTKGRELKEVTTEETMGTVECESRKRANQVCLLV